MGRILDSTSSLYSTVVVGGYAMRKRRTKPIRRTDGNDVEGAGSAVVFQQTYLEIRWLRPDGESRRG